MTPSRLTRCFMRVLNPSAWSRLANQSAVLSSLQIVGTGKLDVLITKVSPRQRSWLSLPSKLTLASALMRGGGVLVVSSDRDNRLTNEQTALSARGKKTFLKAVI